MATNRGICAAHTCIYQYREYPPRGVKAIIDLCTAAAAVIRVVRRARVDIQHGNMGPYEIRARTSGRVPTSSPTPDRRHPLATPCIERRQRWYSDTAVADAVPSVKPS